MASLARFTSLALTLLAAVVGEPAGATDEPDDFLSCSILVLKPGNLFKIVCPGSFDLPDQPANDPTLNGPSTLQVRDIGGTATATYDLSIQPTPYGWKGLGNPPGSKGFKYKGSGSAGDPCVSVLVKASKVKAVCKGADVGVVSSLPFAGAAAVTLTIGTSSKRYCALFGGQELQNDASQLKRKSAPPAGCVEEVVSVPVSPGGTGSTDSEADGATPDDPIETAVTSPNAGTITIVETTPTATPPAGFGLFGEEVDITAPAASAAAPLLLEFLLDPSVIRPGENQTTIQVFRNGVPVAACVGDPGVALPDPCVSERTVLGGGDVRVRVLTSHASAWTFGLPDCGNGVLYAGESCDPPGVQAQCSAGQICTTSCACAAPCDCCALAPTRFQGTTTVGAGTCGTVRDATGALLQNLDCSKLYFGGGNNTLVPPATLVDQIQLILDVNSCDSGTGRLTLTAATAAETGSPRTCSAGGCLLGPPLPIAVPSSPSFSVCVIPSLAQDASGSTTCDGTTTFVLPVKAGLYVTGDLLPGEPGIQPCPLCVSGTCEGGPNNGMGCVAASSDLGDAYPTSHDCPPPTGSPLGTLTVGATITTGTATNTASPSGSQQQVFCGFCRDVDGTSAFQSPAQPCASNADCSQPFESCEQRSEGAFGSSAAHTISLTGVPATCQADGNPHATTLVGGMCVQPAYTIADTNADLPGPGTFSLQATVQLVP